MACQTQTVALHFQHVLIDRAVRIMAIQTVVTHWLVLPQQWAALLGMALVASLVDRSLFQQFVCRTAVRIVA